ncbi:galactose-binding domain-like protein [Syncephalastrum racemosum]|uniref:Galactose-binding domain-like protein n=1 Tax=Syncephalastrum racemosum TaxID=13706 RepID=A0A1X2HH05_SYNRA|nr:galactose-binding domain-like protein [Syncephalastrum racemosum]
MGTRPKSILSFTQYKSLGMLPPEETFLSTFPDTASVKMSGHIIDVSNDLLGDASHLLEPASNDLVARTPEQDIDGNHDGWQSARHQDEAWVEIGLGASTSIVGVDIDTRSYFDSSPISVQVLALPAGSHLSVTPPEYEELLPDVSLQPNSHNLYQIDCSEGKTYSAIKVIVSPPSLGGLARVRCFGNISCVWPSAIPKNKRLNLADALTGARIVDFSDPQCANNPNILLSSRESIKDGWLTPRSRKKDRDDFVVVKLGTAGTIEEVMVRVDHFLGCEVPRVSIDGCRSVDEIPSRDPNCSPWEPLVTKGKIVFDDQKFEVGKPGQVFTHVRLTLHPDGGVQQLCIMGVPEGCRRTSMSGHDDTIHTARKRTGGFLGVRQTARKFTSILASLSDDSENEETSSSHETEWSRSPSEYSHDEDRFNAYRARMYDGYDNRLAEEVRDEMEYERTRNVALTARKSMGKRRGQTRQEEPARKTGRKTMRGRGRRN